MHFSEITDEFKEKFKELVEKVEDIVITGHQPPDDDSIASVLALYHFLKREYPDKKLRLIQEGEKPENLSIFSGFKEIQFVDDLTENIGGCDLLIVVDGCQWSRFTDSVEKLKNEKLKSICIDHHDSPPDDFDLSLIITDSPSAVEIIYWLFFAEGEIKKETAEIFMLGILGDTGNFKYVTPKNIKTFDITKNLLPVIGMNIEKFQSRYIKISQTEFSVCRELMKNTRFKKIKKWPKVQYSFLPRKFVEDNKFSDNEVRKGYHLYIDNYLRVIEGYQWGFLISALNGRFSISLRSLPGSVSVRKIMEDIEIGGGHDRAAGGSYSFDNKQTAKDCINEIFKYMKTNPPILN